MCKLDGFQDLYNDIKIHDSNDLWEISYNDKLEIFVAVSNTGCFRVYELIKSPSEMTQSERLEIRWFYSYPTSKTIKIRDVFMYNDANNEYIKQVFKKSF